MSGPEVDASGGENENPFLVCPFALFGKYDHILAKFQAKIQDSLHMKVNKTFT